MRKEARYLALREHLRPWQEVWGYSVLKSWDSMKACIGAEVLAAFSSMDLAEQYEFLNGREVSDLPEGVAAWHRSLNPLVHLSRMPLANAIEGPREEGLTPKKNHEIACILKFLEKQEPSWEQLLDIGGGAGHLARHIAAQWSLDTVSIDREALFQQEGLRLLQRRPWKNLIQKPFQFVTGIFPDCLETSDAWNPHRPTLSVGLHTCGPLAWEHLKLVSEHVVVLNFGCCYDKLQLEKDLEQSVVARENPMGWTAEALFLMTRGGKERGFDDFRFQHRVQLYRFALHHFLQDELGLKDFVPVGQTAARHYRGSFASYAANRLEQMKLPMPCSESAIEDYFQKQEAMLEEQWTAALLRNRMARPLEVLLILDRAMLFEERGYQSELYEIFNPQLSPRNIGILLKPCKGP